MDARVIIRRSRWLRALLRPVAIWAARWRNQAHFRYQRVVTGGVITLSPSNIEGVFDVKATSHLASRIVLTGCYEPEISELIGSLRLEDGLIVNVGANVGLFAVFLAQRFPSASGVLAVEPNPEAFELLRTNVQTNGLQNRIRLVQACIGESEQVTELSVVPGLSEYSSIGGIAHPAVQGMSQQKMDVPMVPLGKLVGGEKVSMIFVDTEGAESAVFSGARDILLRDRPMLYFECSDTLLRKMGSSSLELHKMLTDLGFEVRDALTGRSGLKHPYEGEAFAVHVDH